ncbi:TfoX/Sxy family protein [Gemmatimonadota bacterium]
MELSELPNIGGTLESLLREHGVTSPEELRSLGAVETCRRLHLRGEACVNKLYALEGPIRGIRWHDIPQEEREALRREFLEE